MWHLIMKPTREFVVSHKEMYRLNLYNFPFLPSLLSIKKTSCVFAVFIKDNLTTRKRRKGFSSFSQSMSSQASWLDFVGAHWSVTMSKENEIKDIETSKEK